MGILDGKYAIVIGGSSGIGFGSARSLAKDGATVTLAARGRQKLIEAANSLAEEGCNVSWVVCDAARRKGRVSGG